MRVQSNWIMYLLAVTVCLSLSNVGEASGRRYKRVKPRPAASEAQISQPTQPVPQEGTIQPEDSPAVEAAHAARPHTHAHGTIQAGKNPSLHEASNCLENDLARAIAWQESRWRQYNKKGQPLTSKKQAIGVMQVIPQTWQEWFQKEGKEPMGYVVCTWDDMKNNWCTNIQNGRYILEIFSFSKLTNEQKRWPWTSRWIDQPNQQDLLIYAYMHSPEEIASITPQNWRGKIAQNKYVQQVRRHLYYKPWQRGVRRESS